MLYLNPIITTMTRENLPTDSDNKQNAINDSETKQKEQKQVVVPPSYDILEDLINRMIDDYEDYRGNDEQWCYDVREVIHNFKKEIERIEAETVIPLF